MMEMERAASSGDPDREAKTWHAKLAETERKHDGYLDLAAEGIIGREELREKPSALEEVRGTAQRELEALRIRQERLEGLERDKDALLKSYAQMAPEALDSLTSEEHNRVYGMLGQRATITMDSTLELSGTFSGEGDALCGTKMRSSMP
jgi:DNA repair exonuclease SbcCD ATPase subunit